MESLRSQQEWQEGEEIKQQLSAAGPADDPEIKLGSGIIEAASKQLGSLAARRENQIARGKENETPKRGKEESIWLEAEAEREAEKRRVALEKREKEEQEQRLKWEEARKAREEEERRKREQARLERERQLQLIEELQKQEQWDQNKPLYTREDEETVRSKSRTREELSSSLVAAALAPSPTLLLPVKSKSDEEERLKQKLQELKDERQRLEEERQRQWEEVGKAKVERWLKKQGFGSDVNSKKTKKSGGVRGLLQRSSSLYPLHAAVDENDAEMVRLLLQGAADPALRDSKGRTALERAAGLERKASKEEDPFAEVISTLQAAEKTAA